jgi:hypothetical protein
VGTNMHRRHMCQTWQKDKLNTNKDVHQRDGDKCQPSMQGNRVAHVLHDICAGMMTS